MYVCMYVCMYVTVDGGQCMCMYVCECICMYVGTYVRVCKKCKSQTHQYANTHHLNTYIHIYLHTHVHTQKTQNTVCKSQTHQYTKTHHFKYVYTYIFTHTYTHRTNLSLSCRLLARSVLSLSCCHGCKNQT